MWQTSARLPAHFNGFLPQKAHKTLVYSGLWHAKNPAEIWAFAMIYAHIYINLLTLKKS